MKPQDQLYFLRKLFNFAKCEIVQRTSLNLTRHCSVICHVFCNGYWITISAGTKLHKNAYIKNCKKKKCVTFESLFA